MLHDLSKFRLTDKEDVEFARYWLSEHSKKLIQNLTSFEPEELLILIKAELLWDKRKDLLKRMTARYTRLQRQYEWSLILKVVEGKEDLDAI